MSEFMDLMKILAHGSAAEIAEAKERYYTQSPEVINRERPDPDKPVKQLKLD